MNDSNKNKKTDEIETLLKEKGMLREQGIEPYCWLSKHVSRRITDHFTQRTICTAKTIYLSLTELASNQQTPYKCDAYHSQLVELSGKSESTIKRYVNEFHKLHIIFKQNRKGKHSKHYISNRYFLLKCPGHNNEHRSITKNKPTSSKDNGLVIEKQYKKNNYKKYDNIKKSYKGLVEDLVSWFSRNGRHNIASEDAAIKIILKYGAPKVIEARDKHGQDTVNQLDHFFKHLQDRDCGC